MLGSDRAAESRMTSNDLTTPLGQNLEAGGSASRVPLAQILAVALGLFFGAFVLWAVIAKDQSGGEPVAVAPVDLHIAKQAPEPVAVPQVAAPAEPAQPAAPAELAPAQTKPPNTVTITIVDGKTGAMREVVVAAPPRSADPPAAAQVNQDSAAPGRPAPKLLSGSNRPAPSGGSSARPAQ
jgi:hypothetical protein